ncbi:MAG: hypothetical protein AAFO04_22585 [Cyanobacteria bacterium J06592_8]
MNRTKNFFSLLSSVALSLTGLGWLQIPVTAQSQNLCNDAQAYGRVLYNIAFPMATYEKAGCEILENRRNGEVVYNYIVVGQGIWFQAPLWTEARLVTNSSGRIIGFSWGRHNSEFWPPGSTYGTAIEIIKDAFDQPPGNSTGVGAVCIQNPTNHELRYSYRWGDGEWSTDSLEAKQSIKHWWTYAPGRQTSPNFQIRFDESFSEGYTARTHNLERYATSEPVQCSQSRRYSFSIREGQIRLNSEN